MWFSLRTEFKAALIICAAFIAVWAIVNISVNRGNIFDPQPISSEGQQKKPVQQQVPSDEGFEAGWILYSMIFMIWICIALLIAYIIYAIIMKKKKTLRNMVILLAFFIVFFFVMTSLEGTIHDLMKKPSKFVRPNETSSSTATGTTDVVTPPLIGIILVVFWIAVIVFLVYTIRKSLRDDTKSKPSRKSAARAVGKALREIQAGGEFREAILRCYRRFCELAGEHGVGRQDTLTPEELMAVVSERLRLPREPLEKLTILFEEARYSAHDIPAGQKEEAVRSLVAIKKSLEAEAQNE